ncbi:MAG: CerR family C-terminal domain-containing protein [Deltaproteobacteria bacterium]|nr:CerR family C-terminal domain-containing protein [Deltaproteobacteria bacterium]
MRIRKRGYAKTPSNLLASASDLFADKGYREATIAEICERAGANIAAVNYHFGDKETLYKEAWRRAFYESVKAHPPDGGVNENAPPEGRLRGRVHALLHRVADENNREFLFVQKELASPTGLLDEVIEEELRPLQEKMEAVIGELLGPRASNMQVRFCAISIVSQCINPAVMRKGHKGKEKAKFGPPRIDDVTAYADHVVKFSLSGIQAIRREVEKKGLNSGRQRKSRHASKGE